MNNNSRRIVLILVKMFGITSTKKIMVFRHYIVIRYLEFSMFAVLLHVMASPFSVTTNGEYAITA